MTITRKLVLRNKFKEGELENAISKFNLNNDKFGCSLTSFLDNGNITLLDHISHKTNLLWTDDNDNIMASITITPTPSGLIDVIDDAKFGFVGTGIFKNNIIESYTLLGICWWIDKSDENVFDN